MGQVFIDSGAVLRLRLENGKEIIGATAAGFAPGGWALTLCEAPHTSCHSFPIGAITEVRYRSRGTRSGAGAGLYAGMLAGLSVDQDTPLFVLTGFAGAAIGWFIGSGVPTWPRAATREGDRLLWLPGPMIIPEPPMKHDFVAGCARGDSLPQPNLVAVVHWTQQPFYTDVRRAWRVDTVERRLIPVSTDRIRCRNKEWFALKPEDMRRAPADSVSAALRFSVSPGKTRVYVYHVSAYIADPFVITIDNNVIGPLRYDRYLTLELEPGVHRLGALGLRDTVVFETYADQLDFLKVMPGSWRLTGTIFTAEPVKEAQGRNMILASEPMPPGKNTEP